MESSSIESAPKDDIIDHHLELAPQNANKPAHNFKMHMVKHTVACDQMSEVIKCGITCHQLGIVENEFIIISRSHLKTRGPQVGHREETETLNLCRGWLDILSNNTC